MSSNIEKFISINNKKVDDSVKNYLFSKFDNLSIEIPGRECGNLIDLMEKYKLEGWCFQTTETAILFLNDDDYIERGNININSGGYYHSWIVFKFNNSEYVFDPSFNLLCEKHFYYEILEADVIGRVSGYCVKEYLRNYILNYKVETYEPYMEKILNRIFKEKRNDLIVVHDKEDVNAPMYRNGAGYKVEYENNKIKKLYVHYYYIGI